MSTLGLLEGVLSGTPEDSLSPSRAGMHFQYLKVAVTNLQRLVSYRDVKTQDRTIRQRAASDAANELQGPLRLSPTHTRSDSPQHAENWTTTAKFFHFETVTNERLHAEVTSPAPERVLPPNTP